MAVIETLRTQVNAVIGAKPRPAVHHGIIDDPAELVPIFRTRVDAVMADMRAQGFDPRLFETLRSQERCDELERRGTGSSKSMHKYGIAADIISERWLWGKGAPRVYMRRFWLALQAAAVKQGLTSGAGWARHDLPHIQAVPVRMQWKIWQARDAERIARICAEALPS